MYIEFHFCGFLILISFSFNIMSYERKSYNRKISIAFLYKNQHRAGSVVKPDLNLWNPIKFLLQLNIQTET